jgi:hypothetical protein
MDPVTAITLTKISLELVKRVKRKKTVDFDDAEMLQGVINNIQQLFARGKRTCVHKTHECTYRNGSCYVLLTKGEDWQIEDIEQCAYRKLIEKGKK